MYNPMIDTVMLTRENVSLVATMTGKSKDELNLALAQYESTNRVLFVAYLTDTAKKLLKTRMSELLEKTGFTEEELLAHLEGELQLAAANRAEWAQALLEEK